jgi:hypothetical protein
LGPFSIRAFYQLGAFLSIGGLLIKWGEFFKGDFAPTRQAQAYVASLRLHNGGAQLSWRLCGALARLLEFAPTGVLKTALWGLLFFELP